MPPRRRLLAVVAAASALAAVTFALVRDRDGDSARQRTADAEVRTTSTTRAAIGAATMTSTSTSTTAPISTTVAPATPPTNPPTTTAMAPFASSVEAVTADQLGASWRPGCPVGPDQLRAVTVSHWGYDGTVRTGRVIVHADQADRVVAALRDVYLAGFPIQRMEPIDAYGGDDQASMRANNTSAFNCRYVAGTTRWSEHAFGRAVDINPLVNPYVKGSSVDPPEGAPYADRSRGDPGMIRAGDATVRAFAAQGWGWGGSWSNGKDYQHFSASGR